MSHKVLLIDDSPALYPMVQARLQSEPVEVHYACDGPTGIELARRLLPELILLDVDMPAVDGFEVCRRIKLEQELHNIPIIFLTGTASTAEKILGLDLGAVDYVAKPFDAAELKARVRSALRLRHLSELLARKARVDSVTGLWNGDYFAARLSAELSLSRRTGRHVSVVMAAVDHFKTLNAEHGPWFGDEILLAVADSVGRRVREQDVLCRVSGPEIAVICPACETQGAAALAARLREAIAAIELRPRGQLLRATASFGVASSADCGGDASVAGGVITAAARRSMQSSKSSGRNRVTVAATDAYVPTDADPHPSPLPLHHRRASDAIGFPVSPDASAA